ncbi:hypothetical protein CC1G_12859 [Coprinopsis cinerea okayama7|uniref:Uncharacterized protein n=1 Tax=Coprinopsis cinerea (strain Okayama-7 / 130 / ATCC MYA-4618 / FGSC 9003) TaxID=240176 RepID=A8PAT2_COPC7|nr:hypothetical protein CC1G_12859 [Coprinopsis cinerea okayama7\|eukprot:XP_001840045.1 hypothetical protein CC1G_12859 [Coprinopsis cinerea okayama7\
MAPKKQPQHTWTEEQLKILNDTKPEFHAADAVKRQAVADTAASKIQAAMEEGGQQLDSKASQALFIAVRGWLKARCKAKRKADGISWKGIKARNVFIQHNRRSIKAVQKKLYEKDTGAVFPYSLDTFVDVPLPDFDAEEIAMLEDHGMSPHNPDVDMALETDDEEMSVSDEDDYNDDDNDNDDDDDDDNDGESDRHKQPTKSKSHLKSGKSRGQKKNQRPDTTQSQKTSNHVFSYFQDAVSELWSKLPASEKRRYRLRAYLNKQRGPSSSEQAEMADKELPAVLEGFAAQLLRKYNVRVVFTIVFPDENGVLNIWSSDYNSNLGGTNFTDVHPRIFQDCGINVALTAWGRREFGKEHAQVTFTQKRAGTHALMTLPLGADGARLVDPEKPPILPVTKPWLKDLIRSYFTHKYVEAVGTAERLKCPWSDIEKGPGRFFDENIFPVKYQKMLREPSRMSVQELKDVLGYIYSRQESGVRPPFRFDYYIDKSKSQNLIIKASHSSTKGKAREVLSVEPVVIEASPVSTAPARPAPIQPAAISPAPIQPATMSPAPIQPAPKPPAPNSSAPPAPNLATKPTTSASFLANSTAVGTAAPNVDTKPAAHNTPALSNPPPINTATKPVPDLHVLYEDAALIPPVTDTESPKPVLVMSSPTVAARPKPRPRPGGAPWNPDRPRQSAAELVRALGGSSSKIQLQPPVPSASSQPPSKPVPSISKSASKKRMMDGIELLPLNPGGVTTRSRRAANTRQTRSKK